MQLDEEWSPRARKYRYGRSDARPACHAVLTATHDVTAGARRGAVVTST
jgi:hypothetical protein